jgi:succinoglycan biosynthesis protein ExoM
MPEASPVAVCIPSFRRPKSLGRLLAALAELKTETPMAVLVADNDAERHEGLDLCRALTKAGYRWPLDAFVAAERGIAQARNSLVARALARPSIACLAMIDDDEWPAPGWLDAFLAAQRQTGADAVGGSIRFERNVAARWAEGFDGIATIERPTGPCGMLDGAGNVLFVRAVFERLSPPWFDPAFGLSGGEDRDFFERMKRAGGTFAWADEARAFTVVADVRITLKWVLKRAFRIGNTEMRIFLKYRPSRRACLAAGAKAALALLSLPFLSVILAPFPNRAADMLRRFSRNAGKIAALFGRRHNEYAATHGE